MQRYLKVADRCPRCNQPFHFARADDGLAYFTMLIVVKLVIPPLALIYSNYNPEPLYVALALITVGTGLAIWLLPRVKGVFIAVQWAYRLYGF